jgi:lipid A ethanolaminephosphotransferase
MSAIPLPARPHRAQGPGLPRLPLSAPCLVALLSVYWALLANRAFLSGAQSALQGGAPRLGVQLALLVFLSLLHYLLLAPWVWRPWAKPLLAVLALVAGVSSHFTQQLGSVLDPAMLRNALHTDWAEARELLNGHLLLHGLGLAAPVWLLLAQVRLRPARRLGVMLWLAALLAFIALLLAQYQMLAPLMRNHKALRYQIVPAAPLWSLPRALLDKGVAVTREREPIGQDARPGASWAQAARPRLLVLVVGETVRAANWGHRQLEDGSLRNTTPLLDAEADLLRWPRVQTCGTDTETSLPCMFAPVGRRDYDEARIRRQQSLLHVLARAGVQTQWIDNQSGCKGVCDGLPTETLSCEGGRCLDDALFERLPQAIERARSQGGVHLLVLHMLGNHGPAYHRRVPADFAPYEPACRHDDLSRCERAEVVNAFDNALRHSDALLAAAWQRLRAAQGELDTAMLFIPDHGESLGEQGLYLHGLPYAIAPREQTEVPMLLGLSSSWRQTLQQRGWRADCLAPLTQQPLRHDHLFHSLLSLLDVRTQLYEPAWDGFAGCPS